MTRQDTLLTVSAAADLAAEHGDPLSVDAIRRAARLGQIANAQKFTFGWMFTDHDFLLWLRNRAKPGPKPQGDNWNRDFNSLPAARGRKEERTMNEQVDSDMRFLQVQPNDGPPEAVSIGNEGVYHFWLGSEITEYQTAEEAAAALRALVKENPGVKVKGSYSRGLL